MRRYFQSLWFRLIFGLLIGSIAAVAAASVFLYIRFKNVNTESHERTLQGQAKLIAKLYQSSPGQGIKLPDSYAQYYRDGIGEFAIVGANGTPVAASGGVTHALHPIDPEAGREFFSHPQPDGTSTSYGISLKIPKMAPPVWVQVVFKDNEIVFDSVLEEFMQDIAWIWLPFVGILLVINLIVIKISLRPLARASAQASAIGPSAVSKRLSEAGMPDEVLNLVRAINRALDRLEYGYKEQQAFIADAAHELRTPVTIMNTHMDLLPEFNGKSALKEELGSLKRLVSQLLDNARIDALRIDPVRPGRAQHSCGRCRRLPRSLRHIRRKKHRGLQVRTAGYRQRILRFSIPCASQSCGERRRAYPAWHRRLHRRAQSSRRSSLRIAGRAYRRPSATPYSSASGKATGTAEAARGLAWRSSRAPLPRTEERSRSETAGAAGRCSRSRSRHTARGGSRCAPPRKYRANGLPPPSPRQPVQTGPRNNTGRRKSRPSFRHCERSEAIRRQYVFALLPLDARGGQGCLAMTRCGRWNGQEFWRLV